MVQIKVDEATFTMLAHDVEKAGWPAVAWGAVEALGRCGLMAEAFGGPVPGTKPGAGYTDAVDFGFHSFLVKASYHREKPNMGMSLRLSSQALDHWRRQTGGHARELFSELLDSEGPLVGLEVRASRVDVCADFLDEGLSVDEVARSLADGRTAAFWEKRTASGGTELRELDGDRDEYGSNGRVETLYFARRKKNVRSVTRLYDKKAEQVSRRGPHMGRALAAKDWVRLEAELHHDYAESLAAALAESDDDRAADSLCQAALHSRIQVHEVDREHKPVRELPWSARIATAVSSPLKAPSAVPLDLPMAVAYHAVDSGLMGLLEKAELCYGPEAPAMILEFLLDERRNAGGPSSAALRWARKNRGDLLEAVPDVPSLLREAHMCVDIRRDRANNRNV